MTTMIDKIIEILSDTLELDQGSISADLCFQDLLEWDSLAYLSLVATIDSRFSLTITREDLDSLKTVNELAKFVEDRNKS